MTMVVLLFFGGSTSVVVEVVLMLTIVFGCLFMLVYFRAEIVGCGGDFAVDSDGDVACTCLFLLLCFRTGARLAKA